jgi:hypothetical protein
MQEKRKEIVWVVKHKKKKNTMISIISTFRQNYKKIEDNHHCSSYPVLQNANFNSIRDIPFEIIHVFGLMVPDFPDFFLLCFYFVTIIDFYQKYNKWLK